MDDLNEQPILTEEERAKIQRDIARDRAAQLASERNIAEAQRNAALLQNQVLREESRDSKVWAAGSAVAKDRAERDAIAATSEARTSATGFFVLLAILVVVGVCALVWYSNRQATLAEAPPVTRIINNPAPVAAPAPAAAPTTTIIAAPAPAPSPSVTINTTNSPPPRSEPQTIVVTPPAMTPSGNAQPSSAPTSTNTEQSPPNSSGQ